MIAWFLELLRRIFTSRPAAPQLPAISITSSITGGVVAIDPPVVPLPPPSPVLHRRGDTNDEIRELQAMLKAVGYPLPRWGVDGNLGDETLGALSLLIRDHGEGLIDEDRNSVTVDERDLVRKLYSGTLQNISRPALLQDRRNFAALAGRKHDGGPRSWKSITGITLHQTACRLGERLLRWDTVGAHVGVTKQGQVAWLHDFERIIYHGNGWNARCIGIEMDGLYAGVEGDPKTVWDDPETTTREVADLVTEPLVRSTLETIRWMCAVVRQHGGEIKYLVAHRQSSENRRNDPGSALWQRVALVLQRELGLTDGGPGFAIGSGYPIPEAWDPSRKGTKY